LRFLVNGVLRGCLTGVATAPGFATGYLHFGMLPTMQAAFLNRRGCHGTPT
jgi:hypothetical protein